MPGISGLDLAKAIKGRCKVIFTTGYCGFVTNALELPITDYLPKPIALPWLVMAVQKVLFGAQPDTVA